METILSLEWQEWFVIFCVALFIYGIAQREKLGDALGRGVNSVAKTIYNGDKDKNAP